MHTSMPKRALIFILDRTTVLFYILNSKLIFALRNERVWVCLLCVAARLLVVFGFVLCRLCLVLVLGLEWLSSSSSVLLVAAMEFVVVLGGVWPFSVSTEKGRGVFLFLYIGRETPENDTDSSLVHSVGFLLFFRQGVDSVLPVNVYIPTKGEDAVVGLWKVQATVRWVIGSQKCKLTTVAKADTNGDVLVLRPLWVEGSVIRYKRCVKIVS